MKNLTVICAILLAFSSCFSTPAIEKSKYSIPVGTLIQDIGYGSDLGATIDTTGDGISDANLLLPFEFLNEIHLPLLTGTVVRSIPIKCHTIKIGKADLYVLTEIDTRFWKPGYIK